MKQKEYSGSGSINNLVEIVKKTKAENIFIVCGNKSYKKSGAQRKINCMLKEKKKVIFNNFGANPEYDELLDGISLFKKNQYDLIIAVGGGSVLDMAKLINIFSFQPHKPAAYIKGDKAFCKKPVPLLAIPTTVGTGSEATHFAVLYMNKNKYSVAHDYVLPDFVILDPQFTYSLPPYVTACSGMDALCQGIESFWSINSTSKSRGFSIKAIKKIYNNIRAGVKGCKKSREDMLIGANYSGKAINISKTTAAHALSYTLTSYCGIPHGHAVALLIGEVIRHNSDWERKEIVDDRGALYLEEVLLEVKKIFLKEKGTLKNKINELLSDIGLSNRINEICPKLDEKIFKEKFIGNVNLQRLANNPVKMNKDDLKIIYENVF